MWLGSPFLLHSSTFDYDTSTAFFWQTRHAPGVFIDHRNSLSMAQILRPSSAQLLDLYQRLFAEHGPRNWWLVTDGGRFEIICGAILT
jgi:hypothetical protein